MKKTLSIITLSLSALIATSAMAAPDHRYDDHQRNDRVAHQDNRWNNNDRYNQHRSNDNRYNHNRVNPSHDWRAGQTLPRQYSSSRFQVSDREARQLPRSGRYQQWYKVNGDYVLVNERNNRISRIVN